MNQKEGEDFFSLENVYELCRMQEHLAFLDGLVKKYGEPAQTEPESCEWEEIRKHLDRIKDRQGDKKLNISVIGEFSTGKSTFINALLGTELLVSSALQGTTVASAVLDYGSEYRIWLQYLDGAHDQNIIFSDLEHLKEGLGNFTTDPMIARMLKAVNVYMPVEVLKNHFRIIDTPGTNVTEAWHEDVTVRTLREISDLSIILISAERPVSETLLNFAKQHLASILPQCIFIVTKTDIVRERERAGLLSYVKARLESELEIQDAVVLTYVAPAILDSRRVFHTTATIDPLLDVSLETERQLFRHTARRKAIAIAKKLTALTDEAYRAVSVELTKMAQEYESSLNALERSKQTDLASFVYYEKNRILKNYDSAMEEHQLNTERLIGMQTEIMKETILQELEGQGTTEGLESYLKGFADRCGRDAETLARATDVYCQNVRDCFQEEICHFYQAFAEMYRMLDIYPLDMREEKQDLPAETGSLDIRSATDYIVKIMKGEQTGFWGGMAAGAAWGTAFAPGIGTVIGAAAGMFGSALLNSRKSRLDRVKQECRNKLKPQLECFYGGISGQMISTVGKYIGQMRVCLIDGMDRYCKRYRMEVDRLAEEEDRRQAAVRSKAERIKKDQERLAGYKKMLDSAMTQLNLMGRSKQ